MGDESPKLQRYGGRRRSYFPSRRLVDNEWSPTTPPIPRRKSIFHRLPDTPERDDSAVAQSPDQPPPPIFYPPQFPGSRRKSYYHRKPIEEIGERLMRARAPSILPVHEHKGIVNVPLLIDENDQEAQKQRDSVKGTDLHDVHVNFVDLMSMQVAAGSPTERVMSVLSRRGDTDEYHHIFCEVEALKTDSNDVTQWREAARWVKYEESIESSGERWSKPHVSLLSLQSLFELRKVFLTGIVFMDAHADTFEEIVDQILTKLIESEHLKEVDKKRTKDLLMCKHVHGISSDGCGLVKCCRERCRKIMDSKEEVKQEHKFNSDFLRKLPEGCEAMNVLVGESDDFNEPITAFVRLKESVILEGMPEVKIPTRYVFIILGPNNKNDNGEYGEIGRSVATVMSDEVFREIAFYADSRKDFLAGVDEFLSQVSCLPPGKFDPEERIEPPYSAPSQSHRLHLKQSRLNLLEDEDDVSLQRTGRLFGGWLADFRRKLPYYVSDFKDALHPQCLASFFFMYIACLTPVITIGGLIGQATENNIGAIEALVSAAICGVSWHLLSGQPLTIIGATGPVLVFEKILFSFCQSNGIHYIGFRVWTGLWVALILMFMVVFDLSFLVRFITRFTEEEFAMLIALIFIIESLKKLLHVMYDYPVDWHPGDPERHDYRCYCNPPNGTDSFSNIAFGLQSQNISVDSWIFTHPGAIPVYKDSEHTYNWTVPVREAHSIKVDMCKTLNGTVTGTGCDTPIYVPNVFFFSCVLYLATFTMAIVLKGMRTSPCFTAKIRSVLSDFAVPIAIVTMVVIDCFMDIPTPKLVVPDQLRPTRPDRGWIINPMMNPLWCLPAAIIPALLAAVLIFMDQQITAVIVNRREHKLDKGCGYHLDLSVISVQIAICSVIGTPWFVAATMESINHVRSLSRESETSAPGERPKFLGVREQRVTGALAFLMIGSSAFMSMILKYVPLPVLFGVFLFMGVSALRNLQLVERILIMFMPAKYQPDYTYLRHVPLRRVHLFTFIQILCLAGLWGIKMTKTVSILFPIMVLALCFVRKGLDWVFWPEELQWLDDILPEAEKKELDDNSELDSLIGYEDDEDIGDVEMKHIQSDDDAEKSKTKDTIIEVNGKVAEGKSVEPMIDTIKEDENHNMDNEDV